MILSTNRPTGKNTTEESVGKEIPSVPKYFLYQWRRPVGEFKYYHRSNRRCQQTKEQAAGAVINQRTGKGKMPVVPHIYVNGAGFI